MVKPTVLHYLGASDDRGGIVSIVRALAATSEFDCVLGVNPGFAQRRDPALPTVEFPLTHPEVLDLGAFARAREIAPRIQAWLAAGPARIFHGHTRAGLAVALRLARLGEKRVLATVHCYGRHRWFYRWAARRLGGRIRWLSPEMKRYYGVGGGGWEDCLPGCIPPGAASRDISGRTGAPPGRSLRLGGVGAIVPWKQWELVPEALRSPGAAGAAVSFSHIGATDGSPESENYRDRLVAGSADLANVRWLGEQPSAGPFLAGIDCLVIASRREPFSIAMLEALHAGVPVLAADSGGAVDIVKPPVNGWLFRSGDARDLAEKIAAVAAGEAARVDRESLERFGARRSAQAHLAAYRDLLG